VHSMVSGLLEVRGGLCMTWGRFGGFVCTGWGSGRGCAWIRGSHARCGQVAHSRVHRLVLWLVVPTVPKFFEISREKRRVGRQYVSD